MADLVSALLAAQEKASQDAGAPYSQIGTALLAQHEPVIPNGGFWGNFALGALPALAGGASYAYGQHLQNDASQTNAAALAKALIESDPAVAQQVFESNGGDTSVSPYLVAQKQGLIDENTAATNRLKEAFTLRDKASELSDQERDALGAPVGLDHTTLPADKTAAVATIREKQAQVKASTAAGKPNQTAENDIGKLLGALGEVNQMKKEAQSLGYGDENSDLLSQISAISKRYLASFNPNSQTGQYEQTVPTRAASILRNVLGRVNQNEIDAATAALNPRGKTVDTINENLDSALAGPVLEQLDARLRQIGPNDPRYNDLLAAIAKARAGASLQELQALQLPGLQIIGSGGAQQAPTPAAAVAPASPAPQVSALPQQAPTPSNLPDPLGIR